MKKGTIVYAKYDNGVWGIKQNEKATVYLAPKFRNGEHHVAVIREDGSTINTPAIFWDEEMSVVLVQTSTTGDMVTIKDLAIMAGVPEAKVRSMLRKKDHVKFTKNWIWSKDNPQVDLILGYFKKD